MFAKILRKTWERKSSSFSVFVSWEYLEDLQKTGLLSSVLQVRIPVIVQNLLQTNERHDQNVILS